MSDIPEPWRTAMTDAGVTDPRSATRPSLSELGRRTGNHTSTLSAMINGTRETHQETVDKVAEVLRVDPRIVAQWVGRVRSERKPYRPHPDANLLDEEERAAVNRLIGLLVKNRGARAANENNRPAGGRREDYGLTARTSRGPHRKDLPDDFEPA